MGKLNIKSVDEIIEEAVKSFLKKKQAESLSDVLSKESFSDVINEIEEEAERIYREEEEEAVIEYLKNKGLIDKETDFVVRRIIRNSLITSISNVRKSRGGATAQKILAYALEKLGISCETKVIKKKGYRPDIVVKGKRGKLFAIAVKRTLKERWSEDIDIFRKFRNSAFVLIKPDKDFSKSKAKDMIERGMKKVYIPDKLYDALFNSLDESEKESFTVVFKKLSELPNDLHEFIK